MRRILDFLSLALLGLILLDTWLAIVGPSKLPDKAPVHLNDLGLPDAWTTHSSFEIVAMIAVVIYLALTVFAAYSSVAKHAAQANPDSGPPVESLFLQLIVSVKAELMGIFACIQFSSIHAARHPERPASAWSALLWILFLAVLGTVGWAVTSMIRMERVKQKFAS
jgi:uncharacterized membrane protein